MNRKEQIRNKARELGQQYFPDSANIWARSNVEAVYVENACVEMAEWLDQHPQWIPVEEELPPRQSALSHCSSNVMAGFFGGAGNYVCGAFYDHKEKKWFDSDDDKPLDADGEYRVTHWMPIVPPRKEARNDNI